MNKRGATFSGWTESILLSLIFVIILAIGFASMNSQYAKDFDGSFGLQSNDTLARFNNLQQDYSEAFAEGQTDVDTQFGYIVKTVPRMVNSVVILLWDFVNGNWIPRTVNLLQLGEPAYYIALVLQILFFLSIGYVILYLVLKVIT